MNAPNMAQLNAIRELANQYAAWPEQLLAENLQRAPTLEEFASFIEISIANIMGGMYGILRDAKTPADAEAWLKHTLSVTSAVVRMSGSDAILKFEVSVKEVPNTLHKKQMIENGPKTAAPAATAPAKDAQQAPSAPAPAPVECKCVVDAQGRCQKCSGVLALYFQGVFQPFMKMKELGEQTKGICQVCQPAQTDLAMSSILPGLLKMAHDPNEEKRKAYCQEILASIYSMAAMMGTQDLPLTDKAYVIAMS